MNFRIEWLDEALEDLARVWNASVKSRRAAVREAVEELDRGLVQQAATAGESREGSRRIVFVGPIAAEYLVEERLSRVTVFRILGPFRD
jgi:plasmid stabilization system protein ParE